MEKALLKIHKVEDITNQFRHFLKTECGKRFVNKLNLFKYANEKDNVAYTTSLKAAIDEATPNRKYRRNGKLKTCTNLWLIKAYNRFDNKQKLVNMIVSAMKAENIPIPKQEFVGERKLVDDPHHKGEKIYSYYFKYPFKGLMKLRMLRKKHNELRLVKEKGNVIGYEYVAIPSDFAKLKSFNPKYTNTRLTHEELLAGYETHKQEKYLRKHPEAAEKDSSGQLNLQFEDVKKERELAYARIRQSIIDHYGNYAYLDGRYQLKDDVFTEKPIAVVGKIEGDINGDHNPLVGKAKKLTTEEKEKDPSLVSANLKDIKSGKGRVILPNIPIASHERSEEFKRRKMVRMEINKVAKETKLRQAA